MLPGEIPSGISFKRSCISVKFAWDKSFKCETANCSVHKNNCFFLGFQPGVVHKIQRRGGSLWVIRTLAATGQNKSQGVEDSPMIVTKSSQVKRSTSRGSLFLSSRAVALGLFSLWTEGLMISFHPSCFAGGLPEAPGEGSPAFQAARTLAWS